MNGKRVKIKLGRYKNALAVIPGLTIAWAPEGFVIGLTWLFFYADAHVLIKITRPRFSRAVRRAIRRGK